MTETLTSEEATQLARIAGLIIPASVEHGIPGADDPAILSEILASAVKQIPNVRVAIQTFETAADPEAFRSDHPDKAELLQTLVVQCYYRDDRVMRSLGMDPRPPFPVGYDVDSGDWSLLDPVRKRAPIYRTAEPEDP